MTDNEKHADREQQRKIFEALRDRTFDLLKQFGEPDYQPHKSHGDFSVDGDFRGYPEVVVYVANLNMLRPMVIITLQLLIMEYSGWQITVTVAVRDHDNDWPNMGLYVRPHEIIDGLQRQYFPAEFRDLAYEGARRGTAYD